MSNAVTSLAAAIIPTDPSTSTLLGINNSSSCFGANTLSNTKLNSATNTSNNNNNNINNSNIRNNCISTVNSVGSTGSSIIDSSPSSVSSSIASSSSTNSESSSSNFSSNMNDSNINSNSSGTINNSHSNNNISTTNPNLYNQNHQNYNHPHHLNVHHQAGSLSGIQYIHYQNQNSPATPVNSSPLSSINSSPSTTNASLQYQNVHLHHQSHHHTNFTNTIAINPNSNMMQQQVQQFHHFHPNYKDTRWLTLEVCREYQRNKCNRSETECKFAHPPSHVEIINGKVIACYDSLKVNFKYLNNIYLRRMTISIQRFFLNILYIKVSTIDCSNRKITRVDCNVLLKKINSPNYGARMMR